MAMKIKGSKKIWQALVDFANTDNKSSDKEVIERYIKACTALGCAVTPDGKLWHIGIKKAKQLNDIIIELNRRGKLGLLKGLTFERNLKGKLHGNENKKA